MICYHGTNEAAVKQILREGFLPDSWFARHMEDAVVYGGPYVFSVYFDDGLPPDYWQFHCPSAIPLVRIGKLSYVQRIR